MKQQLADDKSDGIRRQARLAAYRLLDRNTSKVSHCRWRTTKRI